MDLSACMKILTERRNATAADPHTAACPCCKLPEFCSTTESDLVSDKVDAFAAETFNEVSILAMVDALLHIQESRVKTYQDYNAQLESMIASGNLATYPVLCSQITQIFNKLSESVLKLKEELKRRQVVAITAAIERIQAAEKDKLLFVAALHLDRMQPQIPTLQTISGDCQLQKDYLSGKIRDCEATISEQVEELQALKIDLLTEDSG